MKTTLMLLVAVGVTAALMASAPADIIVLNNGQVYTGEVSSDASGRLKLTTDYGEQFFPQSEVAGRFQMVPGKEAEACYQAGLLALNKGQRATARQLFETCIKYDATYRDRCIAALRGGASPVAPPGASIPTVSPPQPQVQNVRIQCSNCSGSGVVMSSSSLTEGGKERPRPCPLCGGKGYKDLRIPDGLEICADCGGFGATAGEGRSDSSSFILKKDMCPRCAGRGIVKAPWTPPEGTDGSGSPGTIMRSPPPGSPPPHTGGAYNVARQQARDVASGGPTATRPAGPPAVRPVSPTMVTSPPPPEESEEEVIMEDEGGSPDAATDEGTDESESEEDQSSADSDYKQPGIMGWFSRNKLYVILGGCAVLVFAIVFNKMSAKK